MLFWDGRFFNLRLFKYFARIQNESTLTRAKKNVSVMYDIETYCTSEIIIFSIKFTLLCALQFVYHLDLLSNTGLFFFFSFICDTALWSRIFIRFIIEVFFSMKPWMQIELERAIQPISLKICILQSRVYLLIQKQSNAKPSSTKR